jgi:hypothetical protein
MNREHYPWLYRASDKASATAQRWHFLGLQWQLILFFVVALFAALPTWVPLVERGVHGFAVAAAIALAIGLLFTASVRIKNYDKEWFGMRALAESAKTLTWRYMMRVPPFELEQKDIDERFLRHLKEIADDNPSCVSQLGGVEEGNAAQISELMRQVRGSAFDERKAYYLASRVADQREWYHKKARSNREEANVWYWGVAGIQVTALIASVLRASDFITFSPTGVLMTIAASLSAWNQAKRHDELSTSYSVAADDLMHLEPLIEIATSEDTLLGLVQEVEESISREHTMWRAKRNAGI